MKRYDFEFDRVQEQRALGLSFDDIAADYGCARSTLVERYRKWQENREVSHARAGEEFSGAQNPDGGLFTEEERVRGQVPDLQSIAARFNAGEQWVPTKVEGSFWEQNSKQDGLQVLGSLRAVFTYNPVAEARLAEQILEQAKEDMQSHVPAYDAPQVSRDRDPIVEVPVLAVQSINDAHIGLLAWRHETGKDDQDLGIITAQYDRIADRLTTTARMYDTREVLVVLGNDMQHIDYLFNKTGSTTAGTPQDFDSRLPKIITAVRRAAVRQIEQALTVCNNVKVCIVPGNHDRFAMYNLAEVLHAWFRNTPEVTILNAPEAGNYSFPRQRQFYQFGSTGLMLSHGDNFRKRDEVPPLIFADEAPEIWAGTAYREVLAGHWHKLQVDEIRGVRIRHLPGLTAVDGWHDEKGYAHWRAGTGIFYKETGGVAGWHEVEP